MTDEEWKLWEMQKAESMKNGEPAAPIESRVEWLEADGSAQRTAILKLERAVDRLFKSLLALLMVCAALALAVLT
jgi:hypothetical protein